MSLFLNRDKRAGRFLGWKVRAFVVGAMLALGGIYFQVRWLTGVAILVLACGMLLGLIPGSRPSDLADGDEGAPPS